MVSISETGHAKNLANFDELAVRAAGLGSGYNPILECIKCNSMKAKSVSAHDAINAVKAALPVWSNAIAAREKAFAVLNSIVTRVVNALIGSGADQKIVANARTIARKINGARAKRKLTAEEKQALKDQGQAVAEISSSQMSYDNRIDNLNGLVHLLESIPGFEPNEPDLKPAALRAYVEDLRNKNNAVVLAADPLKSARILRNQVLYDEKTGLVATALMAKAYIKSVFGASNPVYKSISSLTFRKISLS